MDEQVQRIYRMVLVAGHHIRVTQQVGNSFVITSFAQDRGIIANILAKAGPEVAAESIKILSTGEFYLSP